MRNFIKNLFLVFFGLLYCVSTNHQVVVESNSTNTTIENTSNSITIEEQFEEDQPVYPVETDDPFFLDKNNLLEEEAFRILVTKNNYQIRQIKYENFIEKIKDVSGDKEQLNYYKQVYEKINFKDWEFEGVLKVSLNPQNANIERLQYYEHYIPKLKQAVELFIQDISRYKFRYLQNQTYPKEFLIRIEWRIKKDPNLTEEEAKGRAIEYLKKYVK
jgi:hypothetical protein